jgi:hypothetical protein
MAESPTEFSQTSTNGTLSGLTEPAEDVRPRDQADSDIATADESPPGTPRWVKVLGIVLVALMLAFAGLHLTGNVPTHMAGEQGAAHGIQLP